MSLDGRKIYMSEEWLDLLKRNINYNIEVNKAIMEEDSSDTYSQEINDAEYMLKKLDKYKKVDSENNIYFYLFPNELEYIMRILLQNSLAINFENYIDKDEERGDEE